MEEEGGMKGGVGGTYGLIGLMWMSGLVSGWIDGQRDREEEGWVDGRWRNRWRGGWWIDVSIGLVFG